jgi:deoxyribodipyrimidine photo-lyase
MEPINVFWFRRDLRLDDNNGFSKALRGKYPVLPIFIFDENILDELPEDDARLGFIHSLVAGLNEQLQEFGSGLAMYHGTPKEVFEALAQEYQIENVITNRDYEPYARDRDQEIEEYLKEREIGFYSFKDQVIFEQNEIVKDDGEPYVVYTPYSKKWLSSFDPDKDTGPFEYKKNTANLLKQATFPYQELKDLGFKKPAIKVPSYDLTQPTLDRYEKTRNFPAQDATSHLGPHLRFGSVSVRQAARQAVAAKNNTFLKELIWREFFMQILYHFPLTRDKAFRSKYDRIAWRNDPGEFEKWKSGNTGYPLLDAGMRQLNATGYMHNRVRMLVASFLCKHLLIDWRWGEAYFALKLLDYEMASNVGNWQWAAGSGVDAAPYFRIFNPMTQVDKFDKDKKYIRQWVDEFDTSDYPQPMVDHKEARERALRVYKEAVA